MGRRGKGGRKPWVKRGRNKKEERHLNSAGAQISLPHISCRPTTCSEHPDLLEESVKDGKCSLTCPVHSALLS